MELREFVMQTICDIVGGVEGAQKHCEPDASINPDKGNSRNDNREELYIEFDVALTEIEGSEKGGGIGVDVPLVRIKGKTATSTERSKTEESRVRFKVPVRFTRSTDKQEHTHINF